MNRTNKDKRTDICKIYFAVISETIIEDYPGDKIRVAADWNKINFAQASLSEIENLNGEMIEQEISIKITGSTPEVIDLLKMITGKHVILRFDFSAGEKKVVGNDNNPILLSHEASGSPIAQYLTCKRLSPERSKNLIE